ncbi:NAD+---dinitrogen-reductase ADP-D-ribosyltransferase [Malonomonas rubra DSM 5091]|uniref:NAD+---dinitrogen-reductase ADP-D-ribosyltransferase n=1 Tax=Malonomonas rubra DSM 5091 TaxID=1122189 RepID=A0A1M6LN53_MALRU|nr:NAD(+)--dinitrogen-reductase ADP-D-ribosyltransferase [Malonomonas rubra]SHJ72641.1 NAD+---dinitrogen-reductase ADP-D-ribosyltransferase [Malonomonas rubra DSM 5091]
MSANPLNYCNLPPWAIASRVYNKNPQPIEIQGVRCAGKPLFAKLDMIADPLERGQIFHDFMDVRFQLHQWENQQSKSSRKALKNSYLRFLRGWLFDSNSIEGAVLKGWVESRMGLPPLFHNEPIADIHSEAYFLYTVDKMKGAARTSAILRQLDLLYEYVQYELTRQRPEQSHISLYRGINDFEEHQVIEKQDKYRYILRLNNLNSFTDDFERAWEFGCRVLKTQVPLTKIFFCGGLLPKSLLKGEGEYLVIGGEFDVEVMIGG